MKPDPTPKEPRKKDSEYMRKAYIYSAILLILGLVGGLLLADRIITAEEAEGDTQIEEQEEGDANQGSTVEP